MVSLSRRAFLKIFGAGVTATVLPIPAFEGFVQEKPKSRMTKEDYVDAMMTGNTWKAPSRKFPKYPKEGWTFLHEKYDKVMIFDGMQWCVLVGIGNG